MTGVQVSQANDDIKASVKAYCVLLWNPRIIIATDKKPAVWLYSKPVPEAYR